MAEKALRIKPSDDLGSDYHTYGLVESVNADGSYQVRLDGAPCATRCANTCTVSAGDRALVLVKSDGKCAVVGRVGGTVSTGGPKGDPGPQGPGFASADATVDSSTGTPTVEVTQSGSGAQKALHFAFGGLKGDPGEGAGMPAGAIAAYAGSKAPEGWLLCDGSTVSRKSYPLLFAAIGTAYGSGDGSTTFGLPDLRGRVPMGISSSHALASKGGEETHKLAEAELPPHKHTIRAGWQSQSASVRTDDVVWYNGWGMGSIAWYDSWSGAGDGCKSQPHNNLQPYLAVSYVISTGESSASGV